MDGHVDDPLMDDSYLLDEEEEAEAGCYEIACDVDDSVPSGTAASPSRHQHNHHHSTPSPSNTPSSREATPADDPHYTLPSLIPEYVNSRVKCLLRLKEIALNSLQKTVNQLDRLVQLYTEINEVSLFP